MPTYEYVCDTCNHGFEVVQKMSDTALTSCPKCGEVIRRIISGGLGIAFKGSGFYVNDGTGSKSSCATTCAGCPSAK